MKVWIVTPVYFDVASFYILRKKILEQIALVPWTQNAVVHFAVIDDSGGVDPQIQELCGFTDTQVISCPFNMGHQRALVYGLRELSSKMDEKDAVVTLDSDGEDQPEDLGRLVAPLSAPGAGLQKVALALRTKRRESFFFKTLYFFFKILFRTLTGVLIRNGNYAAFRGWLTHQLIFHPHFDLCYSSSLISLNLDIVFVPCERGNRFAGKSRMGYLNLIMHGLRMLMPFFDRIAVRAMLGLSGAMALILLFFFYCIGEGWQALGVNPLSWKLVLGGLSLVFLLLFVLLVVCVVLFATFLQSQGLALRGLTVGKKNPSI